MQTRYKDLDLFISSIGPGFVQYQNSEGLTIDVTETAVAIVSPGTSSIKWFGDFIKRLNEL